MLYHFTTGSLIQFVTAAFALVTIGLLWKFRRLPEVKFLVYLEFFVSIWAFNYCMEFATFDLTTKIFWSKMSYLGIAFLPVFYFLFTTAYSQKTKFIHSQNLFLLFIIPLITIFLIFTNDQHHLVWTNVYADPVKNLAHYEHGPWFWVFFAYTEILIFIGLSNLVYSIYKFTAYYKSQICILLVASLFPIIGNMMYVTDINPYPGFDWTPVSFVFTGLIIALGIVRYRMFNLIPLAKTKLLDVMNDGVIVVNPDGFIEDCNPAIYKIFNRQYQTLIRIPFKQAFKEYKELTGGLEKRLATVHLEINFNKVVNYFQVNISPIYRNSKYSGSLLLFHDITSVRKAEEELKRTNKQLLHEIEKREKLIDDLDAFAHTVAHDLRNSLGSIFSASEIMEEIIKQNDKNLLVELTNLINDSAGKSIQITHELLLLATSDKQNIEIDKLNMNDILSHALKQMSELIKKSNAKIISPSKWPESIGYSPWVEEIWTNYISNAIKYGGTPPKIEIGAQKLTNGEAIFWVKDNGKGLTPADQERLFKNFVRLDPKKAEGYGLGLTIVKKIVEKLNGKVGIESTGNGDGSKFYFTLPTPETLRKSAFTETKSLDKITLN